jgi:hypothetical protein
VPVFDTLDDLQWRGPRLEFEALCKRLKAPELLRRANGAKLNPSKTGAMP